MGSWWGRLPLEKEKEFLMPGDMTGDTHHSEIAGFVASCSDNLLQSMLIASEDPEKDEPENDTLLIQYARLAQLFTSFAQYFNFKVDGCGKKEPAFKAATAANRKLFKYLEKKLNEIEDQEDKRQKKDYGSAALN